MSGFPFPPSSGENDDPGWGHPEEPFQTVGLVAPEVAMALFEHLAEAGIRFRFEPTRTLLPGASLSGSGVDRPFASLPLEDCFLLEVHQEDLPAYEALRARLEPVPVPVPDAADFSEEEPPPEEPVPAPAAPRASAALPPVPTVSAPTGPSSVDADRTAASGVSDETILRDLGTLLMALGLFFWLVALFQVPEATSFGHGRGVPWFGWGLAGLLLGLLFRLSARLGSSPDTPRGEGASTSGIGPRPAAPVPERIVVLKCLSCGTHNPEDSNFCRHCGAKV